MKYHIFLLFAPFFSACMFSPKQQPTARSAAAYKPWGDLGRPGETVKGMARDLTLPVGAEKVQAVSHAAAQLTWKYPTQDCRFVVLRAAADGALLPLRNVHEITCLFWVAVFSSCKAQGGRIAGLRNRRVTQQGGKKGSQNGYVISCTFLKSVSGSEPACTDILREPNKCR